MLSSEILHSDGYSLTVCQTRRRSVYRRASRSRQRLLGGARFALDYGQLVEIIGHSPTPRWSIDMSAEAKKEIQLEIGHVLFIDIVSYSKLLITEQSEHLQKLKQIVRGTEQFRLAKADGPENAKQ